MSPSGREKNTETESRSVEGSTSSVMVTTGKVEDATPRYSFYTDCLLQFPIWDEQWNIYGRT